MDLYLTSKKYKKLNIRVEKLDNSLIYFKN